MRALQIGRAFALGASVALSSLVPVAHADGDRFDVSVASGGTVTVAAHSGWHINKDYPWKIIAGATKLDKTAFQLGDTSAVVTGVPSGQATLSGAVCSDDDCHPFRKSLTIP